MSGSGLRASSLFGLSVCGVLFSLLHGGWVILIGAVGLLMVGKFTFDVAIEKQKILSAIKNAGWAQLIFTALGVAIGILVHPGRAQIATFLWTVVLKIGVGSPEGLAKGMEWNAADLGGGVGVFSIFGIVLLLCVAGLLFSRKTSLRVRRSNLPDDRGDEQSADRAGVDLSPRDDNENDELMGFMRPIIVLGPLLAALFAMTIKSVRFAEYFQPVLALWTAYLAQLVDWEHIFDKLKFDDKPTQPRDRQSNLLNRISRLKKFIADNLLPATVMFSSAICIFNHVWSSYNSLHNNGRFMDNQYQTPMRAISAQAQPGDRVYHSNWDEFPVLFAQDDRLRYVSGMDATFLYEASSTMALEYQDFVFKAASSTTDELWGFVHGKLDAKYVMVDQDRWQDLAQLIEKDARYQKLAQGDGGTAYKVSAGD